MPPSDPSKPQLQPDFPNVVRNALDGITVAVQNAVQNKETVVNFLLEQIESAIIFEYNNWKTARGGRTSIEELKRIVDHYLHIKMTARDCEIVSKDKFLATILHAEANKVILEDCETAHNGGTLSPAQWEGLMDAAFRSARRNVLVHYAADVQGDGLAIELRRKALANFGLNEYTQNHAIFAGASCRIYIGGSLSDFNAYSLARVDPHSLKYTD